MIADKKDCSNQYQKSWQEIFGTDSREIAEKSAKENGHELVEWQENDSMKVISNIMDPIKIDPRHSVHTWYVLLISGK